MGKKATQAQWDAAEKACAEKEALIGHPLWQSPSETANSTGQVGEPSKDRSNPVVWEIDTKNFPTAELKEYKPNRVPMWGALLFAGFAIFLLVFQPIYELNYTIKKELIPALQSVEESINKLITH